MNIYTYNIPMLEWEAETGTPSETWGPAGQATKEPDSR